MSEGQGEGGNPFRWIVDPIDGTKSFMKGVPFYSVLIALEVEGVSRVGVVYFPALDEILYAADGLGCWWNGRRTRVSEVSDLKQAVFLCTSWSGFRTIKRLDLFARFHKEFFIGRGWGDSYGNHMVATGRAEVMLEAVRRCLGCGFLRADLSRGGRLLRVMGWQRRSYSRRGPGL